MTPRTKARGFSQQQSDEILSTLAPLTEEQRELAFDTLSDISKRHARAEESKHYFPDLVEHRERLASLIACAKKLENLLHNERLSSRLLTWHPYFDDHGSIKDAIDDRIPEIIGRERDHKTNLDVACALLVNRFIDQLRLLRRQGTKLISDDSALRDWRASAAEGSEHKSLERRTIWEPMFSFWVQCGKPLGAAREGKMFRAIAAIHKAKGLPPPNGETLYRAIRAWKRERVS
jgi:hypothetical protein